MVRGALKALLALEEDIVVVGEVSRGDEVVEAAVGAEPDVALLDIEMPGIDGIAAAAALKARLPRCRSLILTTFGKPGFLRRAMETGCRRLPAQGCSAGRAGARDQTHCGGRACGRSWPGCGCFE